jgi:hypothetical protein
MESFFMPACEDSFTKILIPEFLFENGEDLSNGNLVKRGVLLI